MEIIQAEIGIVVISSVCIRIYKTGGRRCGFLSLYCKSPSVVGVRVVLYTVLVIYSYNISMEIFLIEVLISHAFCVSVVVELEADRAGVNIVNVNYGVRRRLFFNEKCSVVVIIGRYTVLGFARPESFVIIREGVGVSAVGCSD